MRVAKDRRGSDLGRNGSVLPQLMNTGGRARHLEMPGTRSKRRTLRHRFPSGQAGRRARNRRPNGGRLPGRLQSARPEPGPGSAEMCQVFLLEFDHYRDLKGRPSNAHPLPRTKTAVFQRFSVGTQALSARHRLDQTRLAATDLDLFRQGFGSLRQIGARRSAQSSQGFRTSH